MKVTYSITKEQHSTLRTLADRYKWSESETLGRLLDWFTENEGNTVRVSKSCLLAKKTKEV